MIRAHHAKADGPELSDTRSQPRLPRNGGTNWTAPTKEHTVTRTMRVTTGIGEAKKREPLRS
jgi:hypothetical protein